MQRMRVSRARSSEKRRSICHCKFLKPKQRDACSTSVWMLVNRTINNKSRATLRRFLGGEIPYTRQFSRGTNESPSKWILKPRDDGEPLLSLANAFPIRRNSSRNFSLSSASTRSASRQTSTNNTSFVLAAIQPWTTAKFLPWRSYASRWKHESPENRTTSGSNLFLSA